MTWPTLLKLARTASSNVSATVLTTRPSLARAHAVLPSVASWITGVARTSPRRRLPRTGAAALRDPTTGAARASLRTGAVSLSRGGDTTWSLGPSLDLGGTMGSSGHCCEWKVGKFAKTTRYEMNG
ncbi:hypothetical protein B0T14DRAFT_577124, partial [Immersiella caudata]